MRGVSRFADMLVVSLLFAALFAAIHVFVGRLTILGHTPRSRWLSAAGGVAVGYVFLHILPELAEHRAVFSAELGVSEGAAESIVYGVALLGLVAFYVAERRIQRARGAEGDGPDTAEYQLHVGSFALYNLIIGYLLLHREEVGLISLLTYGAAMTLHFVTSDFGMRHDHRARYDTQSRWILAAAVLGGWALGVLVDLPETGIGMLFAFLAGGIVLNVLKEELPDERESRLLPFVAGSLGYGALLLLV